MKSLIVLSVVVAVAYGQFGFQKNQFPAFQQQPRRPTYYPPPPPAPRPQAVKVLRSGNDRDANTLRSGNDINPDGSYSYFYETDNGIAAQEEGTPKQFPGNPPVSPDVARGSFSWTSPEGEVVSLTYVADENGYQPSGSAIPTPPPIPDYILRSIEFNARNARPSRR